jgi:hypothetical protein
MEDGTGSAGFGEMSESRIPPAPTQKLHIVLLWHVV